MSKIVIRELVPANELDTCDFEGAVEDVIDRIKSAAANAAAAGYRGLEIDSYDRPYSESDSMGLFGIRDETPKETKKRINIERARYDDAKALRKKQFEKLKKEFGE